MIVLGQIQIRELKICVSIVLLKQITNNSEANSKVCHNFAMDRHYLIILVTAFLINTMYGLAAPFLPALLEDAGVASSWTGLIFGIYPISGVFCSLITGKCVDKVGHNKVMSLGAVVMTLSIFSFAAAIEFNKPSIVIAYSLLLRIVQGK